MTYNFISLHSIKKHDSGSRQVGAQREIAPCLLRELRASHSPLLKNRSRCISMQAPVFQRLDRSSSEYKFNRELESELYKKHLFSLRVLRM